MSMANDILWAGIGLALIIAELVTGTFYLLVLGIAALAGALAAFVGLGFALQASVAAVMRGAGLTVGGFYAHFASKEELAAETLLHGLTQSFERMIGGLAGRSGGAWVRAMIRGYLAQADDADLAHACPMTLLLADVARDDARPRGPALSGPRRARAARDRARHLRRAGRRREPRAHDAIARLAPGDPARLRDDAGQLARARRRPGVERKRGIAAFARQPSASWITPRALSASIEASS